MKVTLVKASDLFEESNSFDLKENEHFYMISSIDNNFEHPYLQLYVRAFSNEEALEKFKKIIKNLKFIQIEKVIKEIKNLEKSKKKLAKELYEINNFTL